jgi:hypothetical protein
LRKSVQAVVALPHLAHKSAESIDVVLASVAAVLVDFGDRNLDRGVILGLDNAIGSGALAGDVAIREEVMLEYAVEDCECDECIGEGARTGRQARRVRSPW